MDVKPSIMPRDDHLGIGGISIGPSGFFTILRAEPERAVLRGFCGRMQDGLPFVREIHLRTNLAGDVRNLTVVSALAKWAIALETGNRIASPDEVPHHQTRAARAAAWQSFLDGRSAALSSEPDLTEIITARPEEIAHLLNHGLVSRTGNLYNYIVRKVPGLMRSGFIGGFEALRIQESVCRLFPEFPKLAALDLEAARTALSAVGRPGIVAVAWYGTRDSAQQALRRQAAASYPIIADMIAETPSIARKVDAREPVAEAIMTHTGLSKGSLKRIGKLRATIPMESLFEPGQRAQGVDALGVHRDHRLTVSGLVSRDALLRVLAALPPDRTPQEDAEMLSLHTVLSACAAPLARAIGIPEAAILEPSRGRWQEFHAQLARAADFSPEAMDRRTMAVCTVDAIEMIEDFSRSVLMPQILLAIQSAGQPLPPVAPEYLRAGFETATRLLVGGAKNPAVTLFETARRHASRIPAMMAIEGTFNDGMADIMERRNTRFGHYGQEGFPVLADDWRAPNGLVVVPLRNFEDMREESRRLGHCVGHAYLGKARATRSHIFSIRPAGGETSLSTVEISGIGDGATPLADVKIIQHRAARNGNPDDACKQAVRDWLAALRAGAVPAHVEEIREWRAWRASINEPEHGAAVRPLAITWASALEIDWENVERRNGIWQEWRGVVGGAVARPETPDGLFRMKEVRALLEAISPASAVILARRAREAAEERARADRPEDLPAP